MGDDQLTKLLRNCAADFPPDPSGAWAWSRALWQQNVGTYVRLSSKGTFAFCLSHSRSRVQELYDMIVALSVVPTGLPLEPELRAELDMPHGFVVSSCSREVRPVGPHFENSVWRSRPTVEKWIPSRFSSPEDLSSEEISAISEVLQRKLHLDEQILAAASFIARAFFEAQRELRAVLLSVASEILFVTKGEPITQRVSSRLAAAASTGNAAKYRSARKSAEGGYDIRSRYVHAGKLAASSRSRRIEIEFEEVVLEAFRTLVLQGRQFGSKPILCKRLDQIVRKFEG